MQGTAIRDDPFKLKTIVTEQQKGIILLKPQLRLLRHQRFGANSEKKFTDQLPLVNTEMDLFEEDETCCCYIGPLTKIGEESTNQVEYIPASVRVKTMCVLITPAQFRRHGQACSTTKPTRSQKFCHGQFDRVFD